jgi:protein-tyrosine-phosphatase
MNPNSTIIFVCEHGAAKSIIAATYFNRLAQKTGLNVRALARGTNPDEEISPQTVKGLFADGLTPSEPVPQKLTEAELQSAQQMITFCELPIEYRVQDRVEHWDHVPPVSAGYEQARDVILERINKMLNR